MNLARNRQRETNIGAERTAGDEQPRAIGQAGLDDAALIDALRKKRIWAAGLDVYENEPMLNPGFLELDNVVLSPHLGYVTQENFRCCYTGVVEDIRAFLDGKPIRMVEPA